jgi:hypothetical protein
MKSASELVFGDLDTTPLSSYDPDKLNLGTFIRQYNGGGLNSFVGPAKIGLARPWENYGTASGNIHVVPWTSDIDWVFLGDLASASATRKVYAYSYDKSTSEFSYLGLITLTYPAATSHTVRAMRVTYDKHTTGTVSASGTAVTGSGTNWLTDKVSVGSRIGFGSTDPSQIAAWYDITAVGSNTGITLGVSPGTISAGTAYVIEELRVLTVTTNATATNGGVFLAKGAHIGLFTGVGATIPAATTTDGIRAVYWLKDAATVTNTVSLGAGIDDKVSATSQDIYVMDTLATPKIFKYNIRAALTGLASGATTAAWILTTGTYTVTGTNQQGNNGRIGTLQHGPGAGVKCFYFVTSSRVYRCPLSAMTSGGASWVADTMQLVAPGGNLVTYSSPAPPKTVEISETLDRLVIMTLQGSVAFPHFITKYNTVLDPFDHQFLVEDFHSNQSMANSGMPVHPKAFAAIAMQAWVESGFLYLMSEGSGAIQTFIWAIPLAADWTYASASGNRLILPAMSTPGAQRFYRAFVNEAQLVGSYEFGVSPEPFKLFYRTSGIADNSGSWTLMDDARDMSGVSPVSQIQFMMEFKIIGPSMIPARIHSLSVIYDQDDSLPAELRWSLADSNNSNGTVGMTQTAVFGSLSSLTITYRRTDTDAVVLVQGSGSTTNGVFEYWNGSAWVAGLGSNAINTRRRFVPSAGLPTGVNTYAKVVAA